MTASHIIVLKETVSSREHAPLATSKDITPGMLCEFSAGDIQPHSNASEIPEQILFAVEAPEREGADIDTDYDVDGEDVTCKVALSGDHIYALLAAGEEVDSLDDRLGSNADGGLQVATTYAFCKPLELVDNSAGYVAVRIRVEVL
jgi:hypothetical protein